MAQYFAFFGQLMVIFNEFKFQEGNLNFYEDLDKSPIVELNNQNR